MEITLEGKDIRCEIDLHRLLRDKLDFGPYYGENLAALHDRLSNDIERPVTLIWKNSGTSRDSLGDDLYEKIIEVFRYIEEQDKSFGWVERFTFTEQ